MTRALGLLPREGVLAIAVLGCAAVLVVPVPAAILDVLLALSFAIASLVLVVALRVPRGAAFASFPSLLVLATLLRLSLAVSACRLILTQGDAGQVIGALGELLIGGSYLAGAVIFLVLTIVQIGVVTRGAQRVAEVGARFALDALPGKQMAIDADVRAGAITADEARARRAELERESRFYGAMDGSMRFVQGDAIAALAITAITVAAGMALGVSMGLSAAESAATFVLLAIGAGLALAIPSLLVSLAAGVLVTRVADDGQASIERDLGRELLGDPRALGITAALAGILALVPGAPAAASIAIAAGLGALAYVRRGAVRSVPVEVVVVKVPESMAADAAARLGDEIAADVERATGVEIGRVGVRVDAQLARDQVAIELRELPIATLRSSLPDARPLIVEAIAARASSLLGLQRVQKLLDQLEREEPALVRAVTPRPISLPVLAAVLRELVDEGISIRPLREILEAVAAHVSERAEPPDARQFVEIARSALRERIAHRLAPSGELSAWGLDPILEDALHDAAQRSPRGGPLVIASSEARDISSAVRAAIEPPAVILVRPEVRRALRDVLGRDPKLAILSHRDLPGSTRVRSAGVVRP